jgi:choline dehydrogenase-like flavoprotein
LAAIQQAYLVPALRRTNLKVLTKAYVTRIINKRVGDLVVAEAVEFEYGGRARVVKVAKEAILCAG